MVFSAFMNKGLVVGMMRQRRAPSPPPSSIISYMYKVFNDESHPSSASPVVRHI